MPVNLPYEEDFFQRVVNVNWAGGQVFVYGELDGTSVHRVQIKGGRPTAQSVSLPGPGPTFAANSSSYAKVNGVPVFLVCGDRTTTRGTVDGAGNPITVNDSHMMIYISNDGIKWAVARQQDTVGASGESSGESGNESGDACNLVWDPASNSFYYDQAYLAPGALSLSDQVFSSVNGTSWGMVSSTPVGAGYRSEFEAHCSHNDCTDDRGQHVPDGVMTYDQKRQITVKPVTPPITFYDTGTHSFDYAAGDPQETWGGPEVTIVRPLGVTSTVVIPGVKKVFCVAGGAGVFMAGGSADLAGNSGAVALSTDGGATWTPFATYPNAVTTMVAAPAGDIKSS